MIKLIRHCEFKIKEEEKTQEQNTNHNIECHVICGRPTEKAHVYVFSGKFNISDQNEKEADKK